MLAEQRLQVAGALGDPLRRHADVLDDQRRARLPHPPDQAVQPLAHPPGQLDLLGVASEPDRPDRLVAGEDLSCPGDIEVELRVARGAELDQQHRRLGRQLLPLLRRADHVVGGDNQRRGDHQLDRGGAARDQVADRGDRRVDAGEVDPGGGRVGGPRHGLEDRLGDEAERPLRTDEEAAEDLQRLIGVEEGAEPVAGRVLDRELAPDALAQLGVGADLVADRGQARRQLRLLRGEALGRAGGGGVDRRSGRQDEGQRAHGRVGVPGRATAHPAGVVGDHAADGGDVGAGRVGTELAAVWGEHLVGVTEHDAGLDPRPRPVLLDRDAAEVAAHVDQDAVALTLAVEAGAAGAENDRDLVGAAVGKDLGDVVGVVRHHHRLRQQAVGAGVGGVADDVAGPAEHAIGAEQRFELAAQRLRSSPRQRLRSAVRGGDGHRRSG